MQESLYAALPPPLAREYHAAIVDALEAREAAAGREPAGFDGSLCVDLCEHALGGGRGEQALRYLDAALEHFEKAYLYDQMIALAVRALDTPGLLEGAARAQALLHLNRALTPLGRREEQTTVLEEALELTHGADDVLLRARVANANGTLQHLLGQSEAAQATFGEALAHAREAGDEEQQGTALNGLGWASMYLGSHDQAAGCLEESVERLRSAGARRGESGSIAALGVLRLRQGRTEAAIELQRQAIEIARELQDLSLEAAPTGNLANAYQGLGRAGEALKYRDRSLQICRDVGNRFGEAVLTGNRAATLVREGRAREALEVAEKAQGMCREVAHLRGEALMLNCKGRIYARLGAWSEAWAAHQAALDLARRNDFRGVEAACLPQLAAIADERGELTEAAALRAQAHAVARGLRDAEPRLGTWLRLERAVALARAGQTAAAREELAQVLAGPEPSLDPPTRAFARIHGALLGDGRVEDALAAHAEAEQGGTMYQEWSIEAHLRLFQLTGDRQHLEAAHDLLTYFVEHAPEEYRESTLRNVRLHREIMQAWAASNG